jgi:hypothetical protein
VKGADGPKEAVKMAPPVKGADGPKEAVKMAPATAKGAPVTPAAASSVPDWQKPVDVSKPVDLQVAPAVWVADWEKADAARAKYAGKIIEISGEVADVSADPYGSVGYVYLKTDAKGKTATCCTADTYPWAKVSPGSKVKVRGTWTPDYSRNGNLSQCVIVEAGPNPALTVSAEQLGKECTADRSAAVAKYNEKYAFVEGEVTKVGKSDYCDVLATLKCDVPLTACMGAGNSSSEKERMKALKAGDKLKVYCRISLFEKNISPDGSVSLNTSLLLP